MQTYMMNCAKSMQKQRMRKTVKYKAGDFSYNTGKAALSRSATEPGRSVWMYSFYRMWTSHARNAAAPVTRKEACRDQLSRKINRETGILTAGTDGDGCQYGAAGMFKDLKLVHQRLRCPEKFRTWISDAGGGDTESFRRRGTATETCRAKWAKGQSDSVFVFR